MMDFLYVLMLGAVAISVIVLVIAWALWGADVVHDDDAEKYKRMLEQGDKQ